MRGRFGEYDIDVPTRTLTRNGRPVPLEPQVFDVLAMLIEARERIVTKDELIEVVWNGRIVSDTAVTSRIKAVRAAVDDDGDRQALIRTFRGIGYRFIGDFSPSTGSRKSAATRMPARPTLMVLPFLLSPPAETMTWLVDGMSDDIIAGLSQFRDLRVISRFTSFGLTEVSGNAFAEAVAASSADYLVEGSVRRLRTGFRLFCSLTVVASNHQVWSKRFDLEAEGLWDLDPIVEHIVAAIEPEVLSAERDRVRRKPPEDMSAWEHTQRGLWYLWQQRQGCHMKALEQLEEALKVDPDYALAHAGLAYALCHIYKEGIMGAEALDRALAAASRAVQLDPRDAFSYVALGRTLLAQADYDGAIAAYDEAIARNPSHAYGHFGRGYALCLSGRPADAIPYLEKVLQLSPRDPQGWSVCVMLCFSCLLLDRAEEALNWSRRAYRMPNAPHWAKAAEAAALNALGRDLDAATALSAALDARPELDAAFLDRAFPFADRHDYGKLAALMLGTFVPAED